MQLRATALAEDWLQTDLPSAEEKRPNPVLPEYEARRCHACGCRYPPFGFGPPLPTGGRTLWSCAAHRDAVDRIARGETVPAGHDQPRLLKARWTQGERSRSLHHVCNLYSVTKGQQAIRELARAMHDHTGNLPPLPGIFPDYPAPIVRNGPEGRELTMARWGMPSPAFALQGKKCDPGVTNVRNTKCSHWRRWLGVESRCLVPFTSFAENEVLPDGSRPLIWFALDDGRPLAFFAGIWTRWTSIRKVKKGETTNDLFAFLTTEPNAVVGAYHPKAMPVILTEPDEVEKWMTASPPEALALQRPLPDNVLKVVARGTKQDSAILPV